MPTSHLMDPDAKFPGTWFGDLIAQGHVDPDTGKILTPVGDLAACLPLGRYECQEPWHQVWWPPRDREPGPMCEYLIEGHELNGGPVNVHMITVWERCSTAEEIRDVRAWCAAYETFMRKTPREAGFRMTFNLIPRNDK
jgi:hypothetical protein